jgi:cyclase
MSQNDTRRSRHRNLLIVAFAIAVGATAAMQGLPFPSGIGKLPDFRGFQGMNDPRYPEVLKQGLVARRIADQVHVISVTNNVVVQTGDDGVLVADNSFSMFFDQIMGAIRKISDKPIRIVTNSHAHGDHLQNNANLASMGALVFAHPNTRSAVMRQGQAQGQRGNNAPAGAPQPGGAPGAGRGPAAGGGQVPIPPAGWPTITSDAPMTFHFNGEDVMFLPLKASHTDGDLAVYFTRSNVWSFGDAWTNDYPSINVAQGGTVENFVDNYNRALALTNETTIFVPGHGQLGTRADLIANRDALIVIHDRFLKMVRDGMTLEQIREARPTKEYDTRFATEICCSSNTVQTSTRFYEQMYNEVRTHLPGGR